MLQGEGPVEGRWVDREGLAGFGSDDPADRFLVATALERSLVLVTADQAMRSYPSVETLW